MRRPRAPGAGLLLALVLLAPGCGAPEPPDVDLLISDLGRGDDQDVQAAVDALGEAGRRWPDLVLPKLVAALRAETQDPGFVRGRVVLDLSGATGQDARDRLQATTLSRVQGRLVAHDLGIVSLESRDGEILLRAPAADRADGANAWMRRTLELLTDPGVVTVGVVVEPPFGAGGAWPPDAATLEAFVAEEGARRAAAEAGGRPYVASRPDVALALPAGLAGEGVDPAAPLVWRRRAEDLPRPWAMPDLDVRLEATPDGGTRAVVRGASGRGTEFAAFLGRRAGARLVLVENGRAVATAPVPPGDGDTVVFDLGHPSPAEVEALDRHLRSARVGAHVVPVHGELDARPPVRPDSPVARALAACGLVAEGALEGVADEPGHVGAAARWVQEQILRKRALGPDADR